jgi:hypothetical protein
MFVRRVMLVITVILLIAGSIAIGWYAATWPIRAGGA